MSKNCIQKTITLLNKVQKQRGIAEEYRPREQQRAEQQRLIEQGLREEKIKE